MVAIRVLAGVTVVQKAGSGAIFSRVEAAAGVYIYGPPPPLREIRTLIELCQARMPYFQRMYA